MGRPSSYTQAMADEICGRIADGESLRSMCLEDRMPSKTTVFKWLIDNASFSDQYARARETQADTLFDDILHIADAARLKTDSDALNHAKVRIDARKWMAGKLRPKKYGEKLSLTDGDGGPLIPALHVTISRTEPPSTS